MTRPDDASRVLTRRPALLIVALATGLWSGCGGDDLVSPEPGTIRVTTATTGTAPDPDGYTLVVDGGEPRRIGTNESLGLSAEAGDHTVELGEIAPPCVLAGDPLRTVTVEPGATAEVSFALVCEAAEGVLVVTTETVGPLPDPDGYQLTVGGGEAIPIAANGSVTLEHLDPAAYLVALGGVAPNCRVEGENPVSVTVAPGAPAVAAFRVACAAGVERWVPMASGTTADLTSVWADPATGIAFSVGERDVRGGVEGVLLRYDGSSWQVQRREDDLRPRGVWGSSPADVYVVGFGGSTPGGRVLRYDGTEWAHVPGFDASIEADFSLESIWGSSASDIFIAGSSFEGPFGESLILRFDGSAWARMPVAGVVTPLLTDVWGTGPADVYAVGRDPLAEPSAGVVLRYDGVVWAPVLEVESLTPNAVWASSPDDVFVAGFEVEERGVEFIVRGAVWHYDGAAWSRMTLPEVGVINDLWGSSPQDVYAVGSDGLVVRYDGSTWTASTETGATLLGVWGGVAGEVFAVGTEGVILRGTP